MPETGGTKLTSEALEQIGRGELTIRSLIGLGEEEIGSLANLGAQLYLQGRLSQARIVFEGLIALDPNLFFGHAGLGALDLHAERFEEALEHLLAATALNPPDPAPWANLGEAHLRLGSAAEAMPCFQKCMEMDPNRENPSANRARAMLIGMSAGMKLASGGQ